jgi:hypothetical protein
MSTSDNYLGNPLIKKSNVRLNFTANQIQEYGKCANDIIYFIENYVKIINVDLGLINFNLYPYQKSIVKAALDERFVICKLPRQSGKTTTVVGIILWHTLFYENYNVAILAHKAAQSRDILSRIQFAYEHLPKWMQQGVAEWNKGNIELENGSKILASATSSSAIRGGSYNCVYLDEFAFVPNALQEQFFASVYPTISSGSTSKVLITSTPNGLNLFYKIWADSQDHKNDYKGIEVHWSETPGRDEQWKQQTIRNTSEQQFRVEYGTEFLGSSNTLIDPAKLQTLVFTYPIKTVPYFGSDLKIYTAPIKNNKYIITVDVAQGAGLDYSICQVIDITSVPYKQVATYKNNIIHTLVFPDVIRNIAIYYNEALVLVEINDIGKQVVDSLHYDLEYEGILTVDKSIAAGQKLTGGFGTRTQMGVRTTTQVKRIGCSNLKTLIESDKLLVCDFDTINELFRFVSVRNSFQAEDGNDDLVMGLVLFSWLINQPYFKDMSENDVHKVLVEAAMEDELLPFIIDEDHMIYGNEPIDVSADQFDPYLAN